MSQFYGAMSALITPFKNDVVDYESLDNLVNYQLEKGINGFVVNGTTAEAPTLTFDEVEKIFRFVKDRVKALVPTILGVGTNCTRSTILKLERVASWQPDGLLIVTPYYNRPQQRGLFEHYRLISEKTPSPVIVYNVPKRTGVSLTAKTVESLSQLKNIVGIKEASGDKSLGQEILSLCSRDFTVLSGDDDSCIALGKMGGRGVISVISNLLPYEASNAFSNLNKGQDPSEVDCDRIQKGNQILALDVNPVAIKEALFFGINVLASDVTTRDPQVKLFRSRNLDSLVDNTLEILINDKSEINT